MAEPKTYQDKLQTTLGTIAPKYYQYFSYSKKEISDILLESGVIGIALTTEILDSNQTDNKPIVTRRNEKIMETYKVKLFSNRDITFTKLDDIGPGPFSKNIEYWYSKSRVAGLVTEPGFVFFDKIQLTNLINIKSSDKTIKFSGATIKYSQNITSSGQNTFPTLHAQVKIPSGTEDTRQGIAIGVPCPVMWGKGYLNIYANSLLDIGFTPAEVLVSQQLDKTFLQTNNIPDTLKRDLDPLIQWLGDHKTAAAALDQLVYGVREERFKPN